MASAAATRTAAAASKVVKPIFSRDLDEAKRRARQLYRAWYREVPNTGTYVRCDGLKLANHSASVKVVCVLREMNVNTFTEVTSSRLHLVPHRRRAH